MQKTSKNPRWRGIPVPRGFAAGVLSAALCAAVLLVLHSCGDQDGKTETEPEAVKMEGFWISVDQDGNSDCQNELSDLYFSGNDGGRLDVEIHAVARDGIELLQEHQGVMVANGNDRTILTLYTDLERVPGEIFLFGTHYLTETSNEKILSGDKTAKVYSGFWMGQAKRPAEHPVVICPFVMVPRDARDENGMPLTCGTDRSEISGMSHGLRTYLANAGGDGLAGCSEIEGLDGKLRVSQFMN